MPASQDARDKSVTSQVEKMEIAPDSADTIPKRESSSGIEDDQAPSGDDQPVLRRSKRETPLSRPSSNTQSPMVKDEHEETIGGDLSVKVEPGKALKLSRTMSQKVIAQPPQLFSHLPDATGDATATFDLLPDCTYAAKHLGTTEQALECDCAEEWDSQTKSNHACGEDSDCINRATKMECPGGCNCGDGCGNQRFQQKRYADVSVIKTEKKGFGLRANQNLKANDFIFEYIGEVISEPAFRRRMHQYDQEGIKHFYFMSLNKGEFVDATKKGNLGRFCNHSCNPNSYVDKWVVGERLRMGIFAERAIKAGEELTFNYNVDRYGADPQPCYCGEPNCSGYIGGKTQTDDRGIQLSASMQVALGIKDNEDWENAVQTKKPRKKKASEDDEEYVDSIELKSLSLADVVNVMSELYKDQEKWIVVKLLNRVQDCDDDKVRFKAAKLHGYNVFNKLLKTYLDDTNILLQVLDILNKIPRLTRNKIVDAKIDITVKKLVEHEDEQVKSQASQILDEWNKLEMGYRIPRVKRDPNVVLPEKRTDRPDRKSRDRSRSRSRSKSVEAPKGPSNKATPSGPRGLPAHRGFHHGGPRPPFRQRPSLGELPAGWFEAVAQNGSRYYYNASGATTWQRPTQSALGAPVPPPPPPKAVSHQQVLDDLIKSVLLKKDAPGTDKPSATATPTETPAKENPEEKWRSLPEEKQKKIYENTLSPSIMHVVNKYKNKLDRDELKRFAKEISKKLVNSDFKNKRVQNPKKIDAKQEKAVKKYVTEFFDKVVIKKKLHDKRGAQAPGSTQEGASATLIESPPAIVDDDEPMGLSTEVEESKTSSMMDEAFVSPTTLKRRRDEQDMVDQAEADDPSGKKARVDVPAPPPPPPPPPAEEEMYGGEMQGLEDAGAADTSSIEGFSIKGAANGLRAGKFAESPMQVATPPTTGSPDDEERDRKRREFSGINAERMKHLGLLDGANER